MPKSSNFVATLIAHPNNPVITDDIVDIARKITNATAHYWLDNGIACDLVFQPSSNVQQIAQELRNHLHGYAIDSAIQPHNNRRKKLLIADMDSTIIEQECIDELADKVGIKDDVAAITKRAMNGEIAFEPALRQRVALLKNIPISVITDIIKQQISLTSGAKTLVKTMKKNGAHSALVSGGFSIFTAEIARSTGFDEHHANQLEFDKNVLTGNVIEPILGQQAKLAWLLALCQKHQLSPEQAIAVGDGANDLAMLKRAGCGVALHAKPVVAQAASVSINFGDLTALLYLQGYRRADFIE